MADELLRSKNAFGSSENVDAVIAEGIVDAHDILYLDGDTDPKIGWIDKNGKKVIVKYEKIIRVDSLPEAGEEGKIYIFEDNGYFWNGTEFINFCKPTDISALEAELAKKVTSEEVDAKVETAVTDVEATVKAYTDGKVEAAISEHMAKVFEFTDVPVGTLVDYRENEIRIMCPENAVFTKQAVGTGGDPDSYYGTLKAYVPNDAVAGYIEHLNGNADPEILTSFSTDKYGRRYQPTWLALAKYDAETDTWNYYGKNSTANKYVGWDYQIDWYNADGIMIASDCIRISLSNEKCHSLVEPYYVGSTLAKVDEKIADAITQASVGIEVVEF